MGAFSYVPKTARNAMSAEESSSRLLGTSSRSHLSPPQTPARSMADGSSRRSSAANKLEKEKAKAEREKHERAFDIQLRSVGFPAFERQYRFAAIATGWDPDDPRGSAKRGGKLRKRLQGGGALGTGLADWRFDFAWPELKIAVEIDGAPGKGGHTTAKGYTRDRVRDTEAMILGWTVFRFTGSHVQRGYAINALIRAFRAIGAHITDQEVKS